MKEEIIKILKIISITLFLLMIISIGIEMDNVYKKENEYCKSRGWQGVTEQKTIFQCYKEIESPTGTGKEIIKSGYIRLEDIEKEE